VQSKLKPCFLSNDDSNIYRISPVDISNLRLSISGIIIAQKAWLELALHTRGAINNGLTEIEIREAVLQAMMIPISIEYPQ
jgi:hypothetical protein